MPTSARRQRRRVVDAVADHRHRAVAAPQLLDRRDLVFGQQLGAELVDAELRARSPAPSPWLSPVSMTTRFDALLAAAGRRRRWPASRGRSATAMMPIGCAVARDEHRRPARRAELRRAARGSPASRARAPRTAGDCRAATRRPPTRPSAPRPGSAGHVCGRRGATPSRRRVARGSPARSDAPTAARPTRPAPTIAADAGAVQRHARRRPRARRASACRSCRTRRSGRGRSARGARRP